MGFLSERTPFEDLYRAADSPADVPWHREEPWPLLRQVVAADDEPGRALDLGCGTGTCAVFLARTGYDVTALDLHETPLRMTRGRAERAEVDLTLVQADALEWRADEPYDLVLDSGLYHGLPEPDRPAYRERLRHRLDPDGNFVLTHFTKKHLLDWRPVGPYRRRRATVRAEFAPLLTEVDYAEELQTGVPLPVGPRPLVGQYWFRWA